MRFSGKFAAKLVSLTITLMAIPAFSQVSWVSDARITAANNGVLPSTLIHGVMISTDQPDQLEFHFRAMVSSGFEADVFSVNNTGKTLVHVSGGLQPLAPGAGVRETQQRVRIKNLYSDTMFILVLRDSASGRVARLKVGQENLSKPFVVYFTNQQPAPEAGVATKQALVLAGGCEWTCALNETCGICGYGRIGSCLLNLVTCTVSECDLSGC
jgi:hypothetical protein